MFDLAQCGIGVIAPLDESFRERVQYTLDHKTKPVGSLGVVEELALHISLIQKTLTPSLQKPHALIFAGDHGICDEGISAFPQAVTSQMVTNFLAGGAAISVLAQQNNMALNVIDAGVIGEFESHPKLINKKIAPGTKNFACEPAMSLVQAQQAIAAGADVVQSVFTQGCNTVLMGEMGIGNTTCAAALMHWITEQPIEQCVGAGTGLALHGVQHKAAVIKAAMVLHRPQLITPLHALATLGGFEIAMLVGAYLKAASLGMTILVDGFICTAALAIASQMNKQVLAYCIFTHSSAEQGHVLLLQYLKAKPLLNLNMRLGEGSGAAMAYPLLASAVAILNTMASFDEAGVSGKNA
ncbi:nicotinate-nucleotide--dimethylbenzimidazole phosphoribosyltransferase [Marinagarivorans algicola]|uniref:nicotinate-nucleotide--dimethylbenzimidazole phosphoribosyltransferase n=1 Tax=Marinagarivorans algicola TaxID=1513270 RepID=UPI0009EABA81|nr:nicotinate-nucleotide--dimethylbenzimidazole phosphoribosyltransferase [Marinagarivorans algicola]